MTDLLPRLDDTTPDRPLRVALHLDDRDPEVLLTPGEVAYLFDITPKTVGRWAEAGLLPVTRTKGGHRRFLAGPVYELFDFLLEVGDL